RLLRRNRRLGASDPPPRCSALHSGPVYGRLSTADCDVEIESPRPAETQLWCWIPASEAEGEGFEPSRDQTAPNGFRDRPVQPLRHPSERRQSSLAADREELPEELGGLVGEQAARDLRPVVQLRLGEHVEHAARGARLRVP